MGNTFIISDLHLGHVNCSKLRGFSSVEEHDNYIIESWNNVVNNGDTTWILGDLSMDDKKVYEKLNILNGTKKVVAGNHDFPNHSKYLLNYVNTISGMVNFKRKGVILTHCPIHPLMLDNYKINIHGHTHDFCLDDKRYINVSCENVNFTPIEISKIMKKYNIL